MRKTWRTLINPQVYTCHVPNQIKSDEKRKTDAIICLKYSSTIKQYMQFSPISGKKYSDFTFIAIYLQILLDYSVVSRYFCWCCNWYFSIKLRRSCWIIQGWTITSIGFVTDIYQLSWGDQNKRVESQSQQFLAMCQHAVLRTSFPLHLP